ncbi:hypothetical protein LCGC14_1706580 [marine sediment metagenome]|uniref:Uncharacterized protein n=1 Tax=marine sediment metagenome TaxID=412755 RepID=A0A0F9JWU8_9ZZZZ
MTEIQYCEACAQKMMVYRRSVRRNMIQGLIILADGVPKKTVELGLSPGARSDFTTLRFFGLIYRDLYKNRFKWMITQQGKLFLQGKTSIPKYAYIFNNWVKRYSEERIEITDVHHEKVDIDIILKNARKVEVFS